RSPSRAPVRSPRRSRSGRGAPRPACGGSTPRSTTTWCRAARSSRDRSSLRRALARRPGCRRADVGIPPDRSRPRSPSSRSWSLYPPPRTAELRACAGAETRWKVASSEEVMHNPTARAPSAQPRGESPEKYGRSFLWGAAVSAHQVEGGNDRNDWWDWEQIPGKIRGNARSGSACLHWERYEEDLDLVRGLGLNAFRFSIEWSRVEPEPGRIDEAALAHYRAVLEACRARAITPMVTLHHFTIPRWFAALGGFEERKNLPHFERFARLAGTRYGDLVDWWITVNEPEV